MNSDYTKALEEMMEKIKRGKSLRPVLKPIPKVIVTSDLKVIVGRDISRWIYLAIDPFLIIRFYLYHMIHVLVGHSSK